MRRNDAAEDREGWEEVTEDGRLCYWVNYERRVAEDDPEFNAAERAAGLVANPNIGARFRDTDGPLLNKAIKRVVAAVAKVHGLAKSEQLRAHLHNIKVEWVRRTRNHLGWAEEGRSNKRIQKIGIVHDLHDSLIETILTHELFHAADIFLHGAQRAEHPESFKRLCRAGNFTTAAYFDEPSHRGGGRRKPRTHGGEDDDEDIDDTPPPRRAPRQISRVPRQTISRPAPAPVPPPPPPRAPLRPRPAPTQTFPPSLKPGLPSWYEDTIHSAPAPAPAPRRAPTPPPTRQPTSQPTSGPMTAAEVAAARRERAMLQHDADLLVVSKQVLPHVTDVLGEPALLTSYGDLLVLTYACGDHKILRDMPGGGFYIEDGKWVQEGHPERRAWYVSMPAIHPAPPSTRQGHIIVGGPSVEQIRDEMLRRRPRRATTEHGLPEGEFVFLEPITEISREDD